MPEENNQQKQKKSLKDIIYHNTFMLVFSLLASIVIWFFVTADNTDNRPRQIYDIPVDIQLSQAAQEEGIRVFSQNYETADVSITGNNLIVNKVSAEDIAVVAQLSPNSTKLTGNTMVTETIPLVAQKVGNQLADYEVSNVSPEEIVVFYDRYKELTFDIENGIAYTAGSNYYVSAPTFSELSVVVSGPESSVNKVSRAVVDYEFKNPITETASFKAPVVLYDANNEPIDLVANYIQISIENVDVSIPVLSKQTVALEVVTLNVPEGFSANRITVEPETIDIAGEADEIAQYKTLTLTGAIDFSTVTLENSEFTFEIPMPAGVKNVSNVNEASVTVKLNGFKETELPVTNFNISNAPEDKEITVVTKSLDVRVVGSAAQINMLTTDSVYAKIDLAEYAGKNGTVEVPVQIGVTDSTSCWIVGKYSVQILISDKVVEPVAADNQSGDTAG